MPSILVVDDDNYLRSLYLTVFREAGFEVFEGKNGQEGLELAQKHGPQIVFTGIMMPGLTGFELMKRLKADPKTAATPVIISSHLGREEDRQEAQVLGARAFIVKGFVSPRQVVDLVLDILQSKVVTASYRIEAAEAKLDEAKLKADFAADGPLVLELKPTDKSEGIFIAKLLKAPPSARPAPPKKPDRNGPDDLSSILKDIQSQIGQ